jgi:serine/threonine protein kinase
VREVQAPFPIGTVLQGHYRVEGLLGKGPSGVVYLVSDQRVQDAQDQLFVLKQVIDLNTQEGHQLLFEAVLLRQLPHEALPRVYHAFDDTSHGGVYILMEYIEGPNLDTLRQQQPEKRFSWPEAMTIMAPVVDAVGYLHRQQPPLIHGDIKAANIIVKTGAGAVLVDVGIRKAGDPDATLVVGRAHSSTYKASEQSSGDSGTRTDVYGLGTTFYTLLTGMAPADTLARLTAVSNEGTDPLKPANEVAPAVPAFVAQAIHRAMSLRADNCFSSVEQLWTALLSPGEPHSHVPDTPPALPYSSLVPKQAVTRPATVSPPRPSRTQQSSRPDTTYSAALKQAVEKPAPAPKPPRTPRSWKLGSIRSIVRKQAAKKPVSVLQKHHSSSPRLMAGKVHDVKAVDKLNGVDKQSIKGTRKRARRPYFVAFALLLLLCGSLFSLVEYQTYSAKYHDDMSLAREGIQHLRTGVLLLETLQQNPFDAPTVQKARQEFSAALMISSQLDSELKSLPGIITSVPVYGARLSAALHLLPLAIEVAQMGVTICDTLDLLISKFHKPLNTQAQGLTAADLSLIDRNFQQIKTILNQVIGQVNRLQPGDLELDPRLRTFVTTFHKDIPALQAWLDVAEKILPLAPTLLGIGTPTNYLIEVLDSTELRPGGGSIDSYGIVTFSGGQLSTARITDVDLLDGPFEAAGGQIPFPAAYTWFDIAPTWSFRDSNLDADFPTAARYAELIYKQEGGKVPVQGVIAVTPTLIQRALAITGPIDVPEYHLTVTAQNLIDRIHYYQLGAGKQVNDLTPSSDGRSPGPKPFIELLASHFLAHIRQLSSSALLKFLQLITNSSQSRDVQIYLNSSAAEHLLQSYHLDAAIQSSSGDSLFVVDANIGENKASSLITNALNDQVTINGEGNVVHHTTLSYAWVLQGQNYGSPLYRDYLRIYVPPGSILQTQDGWEPRGTSEAFGHEVWAGFFTLSYRQTHTITLVWTVPGAVKKGTSGWYYRYTIQRPAGVQWMLHLLVTLPSCAGRINQLGGLVSSSPQAMTLTQALNGDMNVGVDYTC